MSKKATEVINGVKYNLLNDLTAEIVNIPNGAVDVVIPEYVEYEGERYLITKMKNNTCKTLVSLDLTELRVTKPTNLALGVAKKVAIPRTLEQGYAWIWGSTLEEVTIPEGNDTYLSSGGALYSRSVDGRVTLERCLTSTTCDRFEIPGFVDEVCRDAFKDCHGVTGIAVPQGVPLFKDILRDSFVKDITLTGDAPDYRIVDGILYSADMSEIVFAMPGASWDDLVIPGTVRVIHDRAFEGCSFNALRFEDGGALTTAGCLVFADCRDLATVDLPGDVGRFAFRGCTSLRSVRIPASVSDLTGVFSGCTSLVDVEFEDGCRIEQLGHAFEGCTSLRAISIPPGVVDAEYAFEGCTALKKVEFGSHVYDDPDCMFFELTQEIEVINPEPEEGEEFEDEDYEDDDYEVDEVDDVFAIKETQRLGEVVLDGLTYIRFRDRAKIDPHSNPGSVQIIRPFVEFDGITHLVDGFLGTHGDVGVFDRFIIPRNTLVCGGMDAFSVEWGYPYFFAEHTRCIEVEEGDDTYVSVNGVVFSKDMTALMAYPGQCEDEEYVVPKSVRYIAPKAFRGVRNLKRIRFEDGSEIEEFADSTFKFLESLVEIELPSSLQVIGATVFDGCRCLRVVDVPDDSKLRKIKANAFRACGSLKSICIPFGTRLSKSAFTDCDAEICEFQ